MGSRRPPAIAGLQGADVVMGKQRPTQRGRAWLKIAIRFAVAVASEMPQKARAKITRLGRQR